MSKIRVTVWNEGRHEKSNATVKRIYPHGMHSVIAEGLRRQGDFEARTATLDDPEHGLTEEVLKNTDVLTWWGHMAHGDVRDEVVARVKKHVLEGMGLMVLHSGHYSKIFKALMGSTCSLKWREADEKEIVWTIEPAHPIAEGIGERIEIANSEMYGERFDVPHPEETVFISWFEGGEVFRSGCCWKRGHGRIFYFSPGHETYPIYYHPQIQKVLGNAARWARRRVTLPDACPKAEAVQPIPKHEVDLSHMKNWGK